MSQYKLDRMGVLVGQLKKDLEISKHITSVSQACFDLTDYVLNTEDPWVEDQNASHSSRFKKDKEKDKDRDKLKSSRGLERTISRIFSWKNETKLSSSQELVVAVMEVAAEVIILDNLILRLPPEIIDYLLLFLDAQSLVYFGTTCQDGRLFAASFVERRREQFLCDRFQQRTSQRFDIPLGYNIWKKERVSKEKDREARLKSEINTKLIATTLSQDKKEHEKVVLMPIMVGCHCPKASRITQDLWRHSQQQKSTESQTPKDTHSFFQNHTFLPWTRTPSSPRGKKLTREASPSTIDRPPTPPLLAMSDEDLGGSSNNLRDFTFTVDSMHFRMVDISKTVMSFPKSITHFQHSTGIVFVASLNYIRPAPDEVPPVPPRPPGRPPRCTRPRRLRLHESPLEQSLRMFVHICSLSWINEIPIVLLFTPCDEFSAALNTHELRTVFPSFTGGSDYSKATQYMTQVFHAQNSNPYRKIYTYFVPHAAALESHVIPIFFNCVKNIVLERGLRYASIIL